MTDPLSFQAVHYAYRGDWLQRITALQDVSFTVPAGSTFGFLGANGAGKSTSIKLLCGLIHGHSGTINLFGEPIGKATLRTRLGYLPEQPYFYENLQVGEYLTYLGQLSGMGPAAITEASDRVFHLLDLGDLRRRKLGSFSKGMRQRFGLAQAIFHQPDLIVLDEPFSGLDPLWRARFKDILRSEARRGATLFFSSHILADVEDLCDRYALIDHGRILEQGVMDDLFQQAPLTLVGEGPMPAAATANADQTWTLTGDDSQREAMIRDCLEAGGSILRLERRNMALEDWFVERVSRSHAAGKRDEEPQPC